MGRCAVRVPQCLVNHHNLDQPTYSLDAPISDSNSAAASPCLEPRLASVHHVRCSHPHAPRNAGFGFELPPSDLLQYRGCPIDRVLDLHHCEQGPLLPLFACPGPSRSKICELVDWQSSSKRMGARLSEVSIGVGSSIWSCRQVLWLVQCECTCHLI